MSLTDDLIGLADAAALAALVATLAVSGAILLGLALATTLSRRRGNVEPTGQGVVFRDGRFKPTRADTPADHLRTIDHFIYRDR
jgi:hypothetical protein